MPRLDPRATDPLTAEDVPPFRRRPTDEEVAAMLRSRRPTADDLSAMSDEDFEAFVDRARARQRPPADFGQQVAAHGGLPTGLAKRLAAIEGGDYARGFADGMDTRPGAIVWLLWAISLLLAALAGALVRGML